MTSASGITTKPDITTDVNVQNASVSTGCSRGEEMMVYWRFKGDRPGPWKFGYRTSIHGGLVRMGLWNGDTSHGPIVAPAEIETRRYYA